MEWQPYSGNHLAVACDYGVTLWKIDMQMTIPELPSPFTILTRSSAWVELFVFPNHAPVDALSWSPCGRYLATCSSSDSALIIWDMVYGIGTPLRRIERRLNMCLWSPNGDHLFSAGLSMPGIRVWGTRHFDCERWSGKHYCKVNDL